MLSYIQHFCSYVLKKKEKEKEKKKSVLGGEHRESLFNQETIKQSIFQIIFFFPDLPVDTAEFSILALLLFSTLGLAGGERSWESNEGEAGRLMGRSLGKGPVHKKKKK